MLCKELKLFVCGMDVEDIEQVVLNITEGSGQISRVLPEVK